MSKRFEPHSMILLVLLVALTIAVVLDVAMTHKVLLETTTLLHHKDVKLEQRISALERR
jgi:hypothetical protein